MIDICYFYATTLFFGKNHNIEMGISDLGVEYYQTMGEHISSSKETRQVAVKVPNY
jgi:hypothetical protein